VGGGEQNQCAPTPTPTAILCRVYAAAHTSTVTKQPLPPPGQTPQRWPSSAEGKGTQVEGWACRWQKG